VGAGVSAEYGSGRCGESVPGVPFGLCLYDSNGNSTREAGLVQLRRRLHNGITASLLYTFAKAIDDAALGGRGQGGQVIAQNWLNLAAERGRSNFDQRHQATAQVQYTTGIGVRGGTLLRGGRERLSKGGRSSPTLRRAAECR